MKEGKKDGGKETRIGWRINSTLKGRPQNKKNKE
jgi:hypothetical protein